MSFTAIPVGYLFGILRTRLDRGSAVQTLLATLRGQRTPGGLRDALRVALNDPTLELAYRRAGSDEYLDVNGEHVDLPAGPAGRATTMIEHDGEVVAAHRPRARPARGDGADRRRLRARRARDRERAPAGRSCGRRSRR